METIRDYLSFLADGADLATLADWPPDVFACAATLLERSGGYVRVVDAWPPVDYEPANRWTDTVEQLASEWRATATSGTAASRAVQELWMRLLQGGDCPVASIVGLDEPGRSLAHLLILLLASADEACAGAGVPGDEDAFGTLVFDMFWQQEQRDVGTTLCRQIPATKLTVLPKLHTPQNGITIRSLSHNLALCHVTEVKPHWTLVKQQHRERHGLNVLVLPWPLEVKPSHFRPVAGSQLRNMAPKFGFFDFEVRGGTELDSGLVKDLITTAANEVGPVDMVVFPELALRQHDVATLSRLIGQFTPPPILVGGVALEASHGFKNSSVTLIPLSDGHKPHVFASFQDKHHRWMMDGGQVKQYGLGGILDPTMNWWEHSMIAQRSLRFVSVQPWLTLCTLICEDLARPDPIANLVRAVGPNLVVALLMDGPQLSSRWPSRYGTVLAEDPGCSVLTVSPRGMVRLSRPRGMPASNVVALWKDAHSGEPIEISLPDGHQAIVLSLTRVWKEEFSADGRGDGETTGYLTLSGIHPLRRPESLNRQP